MKSNFSQTDYSLLVLTTLLLLVSGITSTTKGIYSGTLNDDQLTVAIVTVPYSGHYIPLTPLVEELLKRGHNVVYCILDVGIDKVQKTLNKLPNATQHLEVLNLKGNNTLLTEIEKQDPTKLGGSPYKMFVAAWYKFATIEHEMLPVLIERFKESPPDIVISDFLTWAGFSIGDYVNAPVVTFCPGTYMPYDAPFWMPPFGFGVEKEEMAAMSKRMMAAFSKIITDSIYWFTISLTNGNRNHFGIPEAIRLFSERITIVNSFVGFDYPQLLSSGSVRYIGDVRSYENEDDLSDEMRRWIEAEGDERPVIYVSMGTVSTQTAETLIVLRDTLRSQNRYRFVWVVRKVVIEDNKGILDDEHMLPIENIKLVTWAPQVAILRHPRVKLFFTHGGANSLTESIAHGVPVICMPFLGDQPDNCLKAKQAGFSKTLLLADFISQPQLFSNFLEEMLSNSSQYQFNAKKMQKLLLSEKKYGLLRAVDLVEEVALFGEDMFIPFGYSLPWYQRYSVDVFATLTVVAAILISLVILFFRCFCRCCSKGKVKTD